MSDNKDVYIKTRLDEDGLHIKVVKLPDYVQKRVFLTVPYWIRPGYVELYILPQPQSRKRSVIQRLERFLLWLGNREDGECRQAVLRDQAVVEGLASSKSALGRLFNYAVQDGYLARYRSPLFIAGRRPTYLVNWTEEGEDVYHRLAQQLPQPTLYRQTIRSHRSVELVHLALEARDWLLRTGYVATPDAVNLFPGRGRSESSPNEDAMRTVGPDILVTRRDGSPLDIKLYTLQDYDIVSWYQESGQLRYPHEEMGIVTAQARDMNRIMEIITRWRQQKFAAPLPLPNWRFLFTNLQTLVQRSQPGAEDPLPPGEFWLAELPPV